MAFTTDDFQDLVRLLDQHPEWKAELRRHVLTDELLELPALTRQLAEHLVVLTARVDAIAERMDQLTGRVVALAEAQARTEAQLSTLTAQVVASRVQVEDRLQSLEDRVGELTGEALELRYARRAPAYFSRLARRLRVMDTGQLADQLHEAVLAGQLTDEEREAVLDADLVLRGRRHEDQTEIYFLVEVSAGIGQYDVERATQRASMLAKLGSPVIPAVAGRWIDPESAAEARASGVWQVLDGRAIPPG
jgi:hypothetical protein